MSPQKSPEQMQQIARRADAIYDRDIGPKYEPQHNGEYVVIDVDSGEYEVDRDPVKAIERLRDRRPDATLFTRRVADPCASRIRTPRFRRA